MQYVWCVQWCVVHRCHEIRSMCSAVQCGVYVQEYISQDISRLTSGSERSEEGLDGLDGGRTREHGAQSLHTVTTTPINIITIHNLMIDMRWAKYVCGHVTVT